MRSPKKDNRPWLYIHIAKTGGTSFRYGFLRRDILWFDRRTEKTVNIENFRNPPQGVKIIGGHFDYEAFRDLFEPRRVMTFFREPVARLMSNYHMSKRQKARYGHWRATPEDSFVETDPGEFMDFMRLPHLINYQSRVLSGLAIEELGFFGLTEHYYASLRRMKKVVGFSPYFRERNTRVEAEYKTKSFGLSPEQRREVEDLHSDDMELYARAVELFNA